MAYIRECIDCKKLGFSTIIKASRLLCLECENTKLQEQNKELIEALKFVKDTLDEERVNLGMIKAIDACVFHALAKVDE